MAIQTIYLTHSQMKEVKTWLYNTYMKNTKLIFCLFVSRLAIYEYIDYNVTVYAIQMFLTLKLIIVNYKIFIMFNLHIRKQKIIIHIYLNFNIIKFELWIHFILIQHLFINIRFFKKKPRTINRQITLNFSSIDLSNVT